jgi:NAD(P)-dependent dehydrogenase (short-subunit alcohol dehydrogenase family)
MTENNMFSVQDMRLVITGAGGVIGSTIAVALARAGARLCILDFNGEKLRIAEEKIKVHGRNHVAYPCNVFDTKALESIRTEVIRQFGRIDGLLNIAGGASKGASTKTEFCTGETAVEDTFFGMNLSDFQNTADLNFMGSVIPCQVFGEAMMRQQSGNIINISSMGAIRPLTKSPAYCAGKAAITNFTLWLAVHLSKSNIRVNAIAPGFFLTDQNRFLLVDEKSGEFTRRGVRIIDHTPLGKLGNPEDLVSTVFWLLSGSSSFVTGAVIPVDGGFSAYSGV